MHVNFDLVLRFPRRPLHAVLRDIYDQSTLHAHIDTAFPVIARFLMGLRIRVAYKALTTKELAEHKPVRINHEKDDSATIERGRVFQIKEVKWARELDDFKVNGADMSVLEYFQNSKSMFISTCTLANHCCSRPPR